MLSSNQIVLLIIISGILFNTNKIKRLYNCGNIKDEMLVLHDFYQFLLVGNYKEILNTGNSNYQTWIKLMNNSKDKDVNFINKYNEYMSDITLDRFVMDNNKFILKDAIKDYNKRLKDNDLTLPK